MKDKVMTTRVTMKTRYKSVKVGAVGLRRGWRPCTGFYRVFGAGPGAAHKRRR